MRVHRDATKPAKRSDHDHYTSDGFCVVLLFGAFLERRWLGTYGIVMNSGFGVRLRQILYGSLPEFYI